MSSHKRNGSVSRAAETASKNRLHMDRNPQSSRITDPSNPAGRRKEIDNVMKRARQASPGSWDRKLLEVEEKDPNRWRHTGYKQLYIDGSISPSPTRRSRTPIPRRSRSPVVMGRRSRSPIGLVRRSRSPGGFGRRSPVVRRSRSPIVRRSRSNSRSSRSLRRSPRRSPRRISPARRRSPPGRPRTPPPKPPVPQRRVSPSRTRVPRPQRPQPVVRVGRPPSPPDPRKSSPSGSSLSSCSDESCSVCSAKNKRVKAKPTTKAPPVRVAKRPAPPMPPGKPKLMKPLNSGNSAAKPSSLPLQPTRELLKAREASKRSREEKVLEWQRSQLAVNRGQAAGTAAAVPPRRIKREGERDKEKEAPKDKEKEPAKEKGHVSPAAIAAALAASDDEDESSASSEHQPQRLTLSERFGKMAQWSAARSARLENMRITRRSAGLHVSIERAAEAGDESPPDTYTLDPAPVGSYPEELLSVAPGGLPSWDDVRVRYDYYKKRGYLRGLTLSDYVKWEEWWYKYQEWLKRERACERWAEGAGTTRRERRRRGGRRRRS